MNEPELTPALNPQELARVYDRFISARWRGEDGAADIFASWIEAHWTGQAPPEPAGPPEGASVLGGAGAGIRWYERNDVLLGYVSRRGGGCYRVATSEAAPPLTAPWDMAPGRSAATGRLVRLSGAHPREEDRATGVVLSKPATSQSVRLGTERDGRALAGADLQDYRIGDNHESPRAQEPTLTEILDADRVLSQAPAGDRSGGAANV